MELYEVFDFLTDEQAHGKCDGASSADNYDDCEEMLGYIRASTANWCGSLNCNISIFTPTDTPGTLRGERITCKAQLQRRAMMFSLECQAPLCCYDVGNEFAAINFL